MLKDHIHESEWDFEKNQQIGLDFFKMKAKSNKKAFWRCEKGHSYEQAIAKKTAGNGCPYCSGHKVLKGFNDLQTVNPELAKEWHPTKNGDLSPDCVTAKSNKKVWWLGLKCGHEWEAQIASRNKHGCRVCGAKKAGKNHSISSAVSGNTISECYPDIATSWDYSLNPADRSPLNVSPGSDKKYYWICPQGHKSYLCPVSSRVAGNGCPECADHRRVETAKNTRIQRRGSLAETNPELAKQWDYERNSEAHSIDPKHPKTLEECTKGSKKKVWWKCDKGHEYIAAVYSRVAGNGCPLCDSERKTSFPEQCFVFYLNKITDVKPQYPLGNALTLDIFLPQFNVGIEYDGEYWHKNADRDIRKNEVCSQKGIRLIRILEPTCAYEGTGEDCIRLEDTKNSSLEDALRKVVLLIGDSGEVDINITRDSVSIMETYKTTVKVNNLADNYPELVKEWHPVLNGSLSPSMFEPYSNQKVWWGCPVCDYEYQQQICKRTRDNQGCPVCAGKVIKRGYNDLATKNPILAKEWHPTKNNGLTPSEVAPNSHKKVWWLCSAYGHEWEAEIKSRNQGNGCPECAKLNHSKSTTGQLTLFDE